MKGLTISEIDKNFEVKSENYKDTRYFDALDEPFSLYGVFYENGAYRRLPESVAKEVSVGVHALHTHTAGGRIRFRTNSSRIAIHVESDYIYSARHITDIGASGIDVYCEIDGKYRFAGTYHNHKQDFGHEGLITLAGPKQEREIMIHMPNYSNVVNFYIGLENGSTLDHGKKYLPGKPIVYYGSSITQGGCASRPGNAYTHIISINNNRDFINLGFSGSGRGEEIMAKHIASLEMSAFVMDYDWNAPTPEHLEATHEKLVRAYRAAHPDTPIIVVSRPDYSAERAEYDSWRAEDERRRMIVRATYEKLTAEGDALIGYVDGAHIFDGEYRDSCTVDGCHPSDLGFSRMAKRIGDEIEKFLKR